MTDLNELDNVQDDDGFILYEPRAISRYIAEKYAAQGTAGLLPTQETSLQQKARFATSAISKVCLRLIRL